MTEPTKRSGPLRPRSDAVALAAEVAALKKPSLLVFDCDGVLAAITDHADTARLGTGVGQLLAQLAELDDIAVAVLSGRSLDGLAQFEFAASIAVCGSYGGERRGIGHPPLTTEESERLRQFESLAISAADDAGPGAWVERKVTSVVLHVRESDLARGQIALDELRARHRALGVDPPPHEGARVLELMVRPSNKGAGLDDLRREYTPASTLYVGDDIPDEEAFKRLGPDDLGIKVGSGPTHATRRLPDSDAVVELLTHLLERLDPTAS